MAQPADKPDRISPSAVRNRCESRIRKFAQTYSIESQLIACDEVDEIIDEYRQQLKRDIAAKEEQ